MKIISCHLFPRRKTGTNLPREANRPPPPVGIVWIHARTSDRNFIFYFLHVAGLAIVLSRDNWGRSAPLLFAYKNVSRGIGCKFKYTRTVNEGLFSTIFFLSESKQLLRCYLDYKPNLRHAPSSTFLVCEHLCRGCAGSSEPSLVAYARGTVIISLTGSFYRQPNVKHDAEAWINFHLGLCVCAYV